MELTKYIGFELLYHDYIYSFDIFKYECYYPYEDPLLSHVKYNWLTFAEALHQHYLWKNHNCYKLRCKWRLFEYYKIVR